MAPTSGIRLALHAAPAAGFDAPFELLAACHERVERMLSLLLRLQGHVSSRAPDAMACDAARDVLRYFDLAGPAHHQDEERHVLPRLAALGHVDLAARLASDHQRLSERWDGVRRQLLALMGGAWTDALAGEARHDWPAFAAAYRAHIALEDTAAFPSVAAVLDAAARRVMGEEMASRRGLRPDPLSPPPLR